MANWEAMMKVEGEDSKDNTGPTATREWEVVLEEEGDVEGVVKRRNKVAHSRTSPPPSSPQTPSPPPQPTATGTPSVPMPDSAVRRFLIRYQWWVLAVVLTTWTLCFYLQKPTVTALLSDQLYWTGFFFISMFLSLSYYDRDKAVLSAYSIFNPNCQRLPGQMTTEDLVAGMTGAAFIQGGTSGGNGNTTQSAGDPALYDTLLSGRFNRNEPCPCGSSKKFKSCCAVTQVRLKALKAKE